jgi:hypothetical protein
MKLIFLEIGSAGSREEARGSTGLLEIYVA